MTGFPKWTKFVRMFCNFCHLKKNGTSFILPKAEEDLLTHEICSVNESDDEEPIYSQLSDGDSSFDAVSDENDDEVLLQAVNRC